MTKEMREKLIDACLRKEALGVRFKDRDGEACALVGRPLIVRGEHVVFLLARGSEQALPVACIEALECEGQDPGATTTD